VLQVVWAPRYNALGRFMSSDTQDVPPLHVTVHDVTGASLVVQFKGRVMQVLRNPQGVFANQPFLQQQLQVSR
jgi:penicillin V acylase-like amidase (Ntn superfamily)